MRATLRPGLTGLLVLAGPVLFLPVAGSDLQAAERATRDQRVAIVVTTASDAANGNTSGPASLESAPGPDGISLREAILATNSDPGRYRVTFAKDLAGASIRIGSATGIDLPTLVGGGVWVDGDIDGDDRPDVTLRGFRSLAHCEGEFRCPGFRISSSGNRLQNLALAGFATGVLFTPISASDPDLCCPDVFPETHKTFANNVVSGLVMRDITRTGIAMNWFHPACNLSTGMPASACKTNNTWSGTDLVNNTIRAAGYGIDLPLFNSIGDRIEQLRITGNTIRIERSRLERIGIKLGAGLGVGSMRNRISDVLIVRNTITGHLGRGIRLESGPGAADANAIERVRIIDNRIRSTPNIYNAGIDIFLGESSWEIGWDVRPIQYADRNVQRDIQIRGNALSGSMEGGVVVGVGHGGSAHNRVNELRIEGNTIEIRGLAGVLVIASDNDSETPGRITRDNRVSDVSIANNSITVMGLRQPEFTEPYGGIVLQAGAARRTRDGMISDVLIEGNRIDAPSQFNAVELWGGTWWHRSSDVDGIVLSDVVDRNRLACVVLRDNLIEGVRDELSVVVGGTSPDQLSASEGEAALHRCGLSSADLVVAAESPSPEGGTRNKPASTGSEVPWTLITLGSAAILIGSLTVFALWRRS